MCRLIKGLRLLLFGESKKMAIPQSVIDAINAAETKKDNSVQLDAALKTATDTQTTNQVAAATQAEMDQRAVADAQVASTQGHQDVITAYQAVIAALQAEFSQP